MNLTLEYLKKLELPVKLISEESKNLVTLLCIGGESVFVREVENSSERMYSIRYILNYYKLAPRTKIVEREYWVNIYSDNIYISKDQAEIFASPNRRFCKHINVKYEVDTDTGAFIREIEG